jgi:NAD(P)-dependent dehydrogenase (short-subunit alcohol dehydrogenase family)
VSKLVVVITGTSSGIGFQAALQAAQQGHRVIATMRNLDKAQRLLDAADVAGYPVDVRVLDLGQADQIDPFVDAVVRDYGRLDAVVNNAAMGALGTIEWRGMQEMRDVMEVNFFGPVNLTRSAMPHLRESNGHVLAVTSEGGIVAGAFNEAYCASKFAMEGFMESLAPVAATVGVRVTLVEPGPVETEFYDNLGVDNLDDWVAEAGPYGPQFGRYLPQLFSALGGPLMQSPADAARVIVDLIGDPQPPLRIQTSQVATDRISVKLADLDGSRVMERVSAWIKP